MTDNLPAVFGNYVLLELIARGGMAEIYRAKMRGGLDGFERQVAIKKILPHLAENEEFITMLIDEARICVSLNHSNIAQVYDLGRVSDTYYIAMEFIPGIDLSHIIKRLAQQGYLIPLEHAVFVTKELVAGLYFAHRQTDEHGQCLNIVHRDISPHNALVSFNGDVKVIDFGVAKASVKLGQTRMGVIKGKLLYMAPEQAMARPIDGRADIFSAGLCLYKMLTGRLPFEAENEFQIYNKVLTAAIVPPKQINPNIPEDLNRVVMKSLERDLDLRYQDCWAMHQDLEAVLHRISPGYTAVRLSKFLEQHFAEEKAKLTKRISSYPSLPAVETSHPSQPSLPNGASYPGNTPAQGHKSNPAWETERVAANGSSYPSAPQQQQQQNSYPNGGNQLQHNSYPGSHGGQQQQQQQNSSYPGAGGARSYPQHRGMQVSEGGEPTQALSIPAGGVPAIPPGATPSFPSPEQLGFRPGAGISHGEEGESDPTVDMRFDPSMLPQPDGDADKTQNMALPPDLAEQARQHLEAHKVRRTTAAPSRKKKSKAPMIFGVLAVLLLAGVIGFVAFLVFADGLGAKPPEPVPEVEEKVEAPVEPAEVVDPGPSLKKAFHAVATAFESGAAETSAEVVFTIKSEPEGAELFKGRESIGATPITLSVPRGKRPLRYTLKADGFKPSTIDLLPDGNREQTVELAERKRPSPGLGGKKPGGDKKKGGLIEPW